MSRFRLLAETILNDAKQVGVLYHGTEPKAAVKIMETDKLYSARNNGISFTRDKNLWFGPIVFVVDGNKLSENHKLYPFNYAGIDILLTQQDTEYTDEEKQAEIAAYKYHRSGEAETSLLPRGTKAEPWYPGDRLSDSGFDGDFTLSNFHRYVIGLKITDYAEHNNPNFKGYDLSLNNLINMIKLFKQFCPNGSIECSKNSSDELKQFVQSL